MILIYNSQRSKTCCLHNHILPLRVTPLLVCAAQWASRFDTREKTFQILASSSNKCCSPSSALIESCLWEPLLMKVREPQTSRHTTLIKPAMCVHVDVCMWCVHVDVCMWMCVHVVCVNVVFVHVCACGVCVHVDVCMWCVCVWMCVHVGVCACGCVCMWCVCMWCVHVDVCACGCVCMCVLIWMRRGTTFLIYIHVVLTL